SFGKGFGCFKPTKRKSRSSSAWNTTVKMAPMRRFCASWCSMAVLLIPSSFRPWPGCRLRRLGGQDDPPLVTLADVQHLHGHSRGHAAAHMQYDGFLLGPAGHFTGQYTSQLGRFDKLVVHAVV